MDGTRDDFLLNRSLCFSSAGNRRQTWSSRATRPNGRNFNYAWAPRMNVLYCANKKKRKKNFSSGHLWSLKEGYGRPTSANCIAHVIPPPLVHSYVLLLQAEYRKGFYQCTDWQVGNVLLTGSTRRPRCQGTNRKAWRQGENIHSVWNKPDIVFGPTLLVPKRWTVMVYSDSDRWLYELLLSFLGL